MEIQKFFKIDKKMIVQKSTLLFLLFIFLGAFSAMGMNDLYADIIPTDRRIDWNPGVPGGIPNYLIGVNVMDYGATGDGVTDDTAAIKNAINDCPERQAVYLPEGTYKITGKLSIGKSIVLRGDGPDKSKIIADLSSGSNGIIGLYGGGTGSAINITSGYTKDSTSLTVADAARLAVGDYIAVYQDNNDLVDTGAYGCGYCGLLGDGTHHMAQILEITAVNGNTITISRPLYYTFESQYDPEVRELNMLEGAGIEDLYIELEAEGGYENNIWMVQCAKCWIKNVESYNARDFHARVEQCFASEIRDSYFHHGISGYASGRAYGVTLWEANSDVLVENNIFYYLRHSMVFEGGGSGNVFGYSYSDRMFGDSNPANTNWIMADLSTHGAHPYMNLFEGNIGNHIGEDSTHGSASHNTYFRNYIDRESEREPSGEATGHLVCVDIHGSNLYINLVGNILGQPSDTGEYEAENKNCWPSESYVYKLGYYEDGDCDAAGNDPNVKTTLLRHGNFDYITDSTVWDPSISDHNLPNSLYLSSKPAFFGDLPWPPFGQDLIPMVGTLPAKQRFDDMQRGEDTTSPVLSEGSPSGTLPSGTTNTILSLSTNENATCRYSTLPGTSYSLLTNTFTTTGSTSHSQRVTVLVDGGNYHYYIRCQDTSGNANITDYTISFSVAVPDYQTPSTPTNLTSIAVSSSQINLTWNASTDNVKVTGYKIYRDGVQVDTSPTNAYSDTGLTPLTPYIYSVSAYDAADNESDQSSPVIETTLDLSKYIEAETGDLTSPMQIVSDSQASQNAYIQTTTWDSGNATYTFNIDTDGIYKIIGRIYSQDTGSNSFYVKIDDQIEDVWDINPESNPNGFNVWTEDEVTKRGTGTHDNPQYDPYTIELKQGTHTITFRGRERNTRLDYFYFLIVEESGEDTNPPLAPNNLRIQ